MSKNFSASLVLAAAFVMFAFGVYPADHAFAITEAQPESCTGGCGVTDDAGACIDSAADNNCGGTSGGKACGCHTHTNKGTGNSTCDCGTG